MLSIEDHIDGNISIVELRVRDELRADEARAAIEVITRKVAERRPVRALWIDERPPRSSLRPGDLWHSIRTAKHVADCSTHVAFVGNGGLSSLMHHLPRPVMGARARSFPEGAEEQARNWLSLAAQPQEVPGGIELKETAWIP